MRAYLSFLTLGTMACDLPTPAVRERLHRKEDLNVLAPHCSASSTATPLEVEARVDVEDFGPATGNQLETNWDFGDGAVAQENRPRPRITNGAPLQYRFGTSVKHSYAQAGTYIVTATVTNGARVAKCSMSLTLLPRGQTMSHPQG
jgi:hypothetical protein